MATRNKKETRPVTKKQREHIHHCPVCDRFRKIVRASLEPVFEEFRFLVSMEGRTHLFIQREYIWRLRNALFDPFFKIDRAFSVFEMKRIEKMTADEFEAYLAQELSDSNTQPIVPQIMSAQNGSRERPKLILLQSGLQREAVVHGHAGNSITE